MECMLEEMRKINISLIGLAAADQRKGKEAEAPGTSAECKTPEPRKRAEQQEAAIRNLAESGVAQEGGRTTKRPHITGERFSIEGDPWSDRQADQSRDKQPGRFGSIPGWSGKVQSAATTRLLR